jgi:Tfp pilus assembly protein PilW
MNRPCHTHGHTLPELLVGLSVGLVVIAAASVTLGISRQSWLTLSAAESVHTNARAALRALRTQALWWVPWTWSTSPPTLGN